MPSLRVPWHLMHVRSLWHAAQGRMLRLAAKLWCPGPGVMLAKPGGWTRRAVVGLNPPRLSMPTPERWWQPRQKVCDRWHEEQRQEARRASAACLNS